MSAPTPAPKPAREPWLAWFARNLTRWTGTSWAFALAVGVVAVWAAVGPSVHYSDTWQLVINTGTTIVTFWMVFLIQRAQNNDSRAVHMKLDEVIAAIKGASNRLIKIEELTEPELAELQSKFEQLRATVVGTTCGAERHSVEEVMKVAQTAIEKAEKVEKAVAN